MSNLSGLPAITYGGLDGEGRFTQVTAGTGINPVNSVSYNNTDPGTSPNQPLGALLAVSLGTSTSGQYDSDSFSYDKNTGRLKQYTFSVGNPAQTDVGQLTWNANGSLQKLQITDSISGAIDSQTCNFTHDDLGRVATTDCGSIWYQSFAYDTFGNVKKALSTAQPQPPGVSFQPTYDTTNNTNRISSLPGGSVSYDANGDLTNDTIHTYTWDAEGKMVSVTTGGSTVNLTYDALGRMVEQQRGTAYQQIVYGPDGSKLALMNGQTLTKAFVPLPGGATAVYSSSGLQYYRHSDHLGSSRLASTPTRTRYYSGAYAPFGESYAECTNPPCTGIPIDRSFTGQNEDTVTGTADFMEREYSSNQQGRWISPDPAGVAAASLTDPQSWNRYAYVLNNPLSLVDPLGLVSDCKYISGSASCYSPGSNNPPFSTFAGPDPNGLYMGFGAPPPGFSRFGGLLNYGGRLSTGPNSEFPTECLMDASTGASVCPQGAYVGLAGDTGNHLNPWEMRSTVVALLRAKNDCSAWFNKGTGSAADIMSHVPITLFDPKGPIPDADAMTPSSPFGAIQVSSRGRFYANSDNGLPVGGVFNPGSYGARMIILLHELAHKVNPPGITEDRFSTVASEKNTATVMDHCGNAVIMNWQYFPN